MLSESHAREREGERERGREGERERIFVRGTAIEREGERERESERCVREKAKERRTHKVCV